MRNFILLMILSFPLALFSQNDEYLINDIGVNYRGFDKIPYEFYFRRINLKKKSGIYVKSTYGSYKPSVSYGIGIDNTNPASTGSMDIHYTVKAFVIKPGFYYRISRPGNTDKILPRTSSTYMAIFANLAYANHNLVFNFNDPVFGKVSKQLSETVIYNSIEMELSESIHVSKVLNFNFSVCFGFKLNQKKVFDNFVPNFSNVTTYTPGQGYGQVMYVNLCGGLGFNF